LLALFIDILTFIFSEKDLKKNPIKVTLPTVLTLKSTLLSNKSS